MLSTGKNKGLFWLLPLCMLLSTMGCSLKKEVSWNEYVDYVANPEHGLVEHKYVNHLQISLTYLPPDYLGYMELREDTSFSLAQKDSVMSSYAGNMTFLLSIKPDEREGDSPIEDVLFYDLADRSEYNQRMMYLNFGLKESIQLYCDSSVVYHPVMTNMENHYGLSKGRNIMVVFSPVRSSDEFRNTKHLTFCWEDDLFETGRHYFDFDTSDLFSVPALKL